MDKRELIGGILTVADLVIMAHGNKDQSIEDAMITIKKLIQILDEVTIQFNANRCMDFSNR